MKKVIKGLTSIASTAIMYSILHFVIIENLYLEDIVSVRTAIIISIIFGLLFYILLSTHISNLILIRASKLEDKLNKMNLKELALTVVGAFIGLSIANLIGFAIRGFGVIGTIITVLLNLILGFMGIRVAHRKKDEVNIQEFQKVLMLPAPVEKPKEEIRVYGCPKILDTSVIIDGRILEILQTGFIEGEIIIPNFVLNELRHIADSADDLKRKRGRRGLDILNEIQKQLSVPVHIRDFSVKEEMEVDAMLLKMAEKMDAFVVTNDYNLNKVAEFQGVKILNINELANVVKPIVLPGEEMVVTIIKNGKEAGQGVGYLNDGTMIVVEGGNKFVGEEKHVVVTSVLQTSAGRMIFAKVIMDS